MNEKPYRLGVIAVIENDAHEFLVGNRRDRSNAWQFPQGGIDQNEDPELAVFREVFEETACQKMKLIKRLPETISYDFPKDLNVKISKKFRGQSMYWFHLKYNPKFPADLNAAKDQEFDKISWRPIKQIANEVVEWKKEFYLLGLKELGLLK